MCGWIYHTQKVVYLLVFCFCFFFYMHMFNDGNRMKKSFLHWFYYIIYIMMPEKFWFYYKKELKKKKKKSVFMCSKNICARSTRNISNMQSNIRDLVLKKNARQRLAFYKIRKMVCIKDWLSSRIFFILRVVYLCTKP